MKRVQFKEILFLSYKRKTARRINLNYRTIIVKGENESGKSCVLKSLYFALGCSIRQIAPGWLFDNIITLLKFSINNVSFQSIRMGNDYYLFTSDEKCILHTKSQDEISNIFRFYLSINLSSDIDKSVLNTNSLFIPFYLDQDSGWSQPFESFGKLPSKLTTLRLHTTIISDDYLNLYSKREKIIDKKKVIQIELNQNRCLLDLYIKKFKDIPLLCIDENRFKEGIEELLNDLNDLNSNRIELLKRIEKLNGEKYSLEFSIQKLHNNIDEIEKDYKFALNREDVMRCPMCGAEIDNDESSRFQYLHDRDECIDRLIENDKRLDEVKKELCQKLNLSKEISDKINDIQNLLSKKQEDLSLKDYLEIRVKEEIEHLIKEKCMDMSTQLQKLATELLSLEGTIKIERKEDRRKDIQQEFSNNVNIALMKFGIKRDKPIKFLINGKINISGSNVPKYIMAYNYALLSVMSRRTCPIIAPLVIDGPKQNGIEQESLNKILKFIIENRPIDSQLVISLTEDEHVGNISGAQYIHLSSDKNVLNSDEFMSVKYEVENLLVKNFRLEN